MLIPIALVQPFVGVILWSWVSFMNPHRLVYGGIALEVPWAMLIFAATIIGCLVAREPKRFPWNGVTILVALFLVMITFTTVFALGPRDRRARRSTRPSSRSSCSLLVTAALLTSRERIHALVWVMVLSLGLLRHQGGRLYSDGRWRQQGIWSTQFDDIRQQSLGRWTFGQPSVDELSADGISLRHRPVRTCCNDGVNAVRSRRQLFPRRIPRAGSGELLLLV